MSLSALLKSMHQRPVYIWGTRMTGRGLFCSLARNGIPVHGFIDREESKWGATIDSLPVLSPGAFFSMNTEPKSFVVIAAAVHEQEIAHLLLKNAYVMNDDFCSARDLCSTFYNIDILGMCNLRCPTCPQGNSSRNGPPRILMSPELLDQIVEKIIAETPFITHVALYNWGEPLLHPQLSQMISAVKRHRIYCAISSNLNHKVDFHPILRAGLDYLKVSVSGTGPRYESAHRGGNFARFLANLKALRQAIKRENSSITVELYFHKYRDNRDDMPAIQQLASDYGFDFTACYAVFSPVEKLINFHRGIISDQDLNAIGMLLVTPDEGRDIAAQIPQQPCPWLENQVNINADGSLSICCNSFEPDSIIATSYLSHTLNEIQYMKRSHPLCQACMEYRIHQYFLGSNESGWKQLEQARWHQNPNYSMDRHVVERSGHSEHQRTQARI